MQQTDTDSKRFDWFDRHRFIVVIIAILLAWSPIVWLIYDKADEMTRQPCQLCAMKMGSTVSCTAYGGIPIHKNFYVNGSITDDIKQTQEMVQRLVDEQIRLGTDRIEKINFTFEQ